MIATNTLALPAVLHQAQVLATATTNAVLDDTAVQEHAKQFFIGTFQDERLRQHGGDAIWTAVKYSVTPSWARPVTPPTSTPAASQTAPARPASSPGAKEPHLQVPPASVSAPPSHVPSGTVEVAPLSGSDVAQPAQPDVDMAKACLEATA